MDRSVGSVVRAIPCTSSSMTGERRACDHSTDRDTRPSASADPVTPPLSDVFHVSYIFLRFSPLSFSFFAYFDFLISFLSHLTSYSIFIYHNLFPILDHYLCCARTFPVLSAGMGCLALVCQPGWWRCGRSG